MKPILNSLLQRTYAEVVADFFARELCHGLPVRCRFRVYDGWWLLRLRSGDIVRTFRTRSRGLFAPGWDLWCTCFVHYAVSEFAQTIRDLKFPEWQKTPADVTPWASRLVETLIERTSQKVVWPVSLESEGDA